MTYSKEIVREWLDQVAERAKEYPEWVDVFERCYTDTLDNTVEILEDGSTFVLTGDIPAMYRFFPIQYKRFQRGNTYANYSPFSTKFSFDKNAIIFDNTLIQ